MSLTELMGLIDTLPADELSKLRAYVDARDDVMSSPKRRTNIPALLEAAEKFREGLTEEELDRITEAIDPEHFEKYYKKPERESTP